MNCRHRKTSSSIYGEKEKEEQVYTNSKNSQVKQENSVQVKNKIKPKYDSTSFQINNVIQLLNRNSRHEIPSKKTKLQVTKLFAIPLVVKEFCQRKRRRQHGNCAQKFREKKIALT